MNVSPCCVPRWASWICTQNAVKTFIYNCQPSLHNSRPGNGQKIGTENTKRERMLAVPKTVEDDGMPKDVHVPATGLDGELIFGCKWVQQIHTSHVLVVGTNNVRPLSFNVGSGGLVPALKPLHRFRSSKGWHKCDSPVVIPFESTDAVIPLHSDIISSSPLFPQALLSLKVTVGQVHLPGCSHVMNSPIKELH